MLASSPARLSSLPVLILAAFAVGCTENEDRQIEAAAETAPPPAAQCEELGDILGSTGSVMGDVCKVVFPRSDLSVNLLGATLPTGMGLTSWAAFGPAGDRGAIVMGDLALTSNELPHVMSGLREQGIQVTAVHRHMLSETPTMNFMHYLGIGEATEIARALRTALDRAPGTAEPAATQREASPQQQGLVAGLACARIAETLGTDPTEASEGPGYCKVSIPRTDLEVRVDGTPVPASLGIGSWFAFRETNDGRDAVIAGDMALTQPQVNPAIQALRRSGIAVVALHNHMMLEEPRIMFFHFQARGEPGDLAEGLRAGLDAAAQATRVAVATGRP